MIPPKLSTLVFALVLSSLDVQAASITPSPDYASLCGPDADPDVGAICFDLTYDIREHIRGRSFTFVGALDQDNSNHLAIKVPSQVWFTTLQHRVVLDPINQRSVRCVKYTITSFEDGETHRKGLYCPGKPHVSV
ncbi:hypothetical protein EX895_002004 [Sporisorium graminicola]|uniref:Uncharacterized protein n=1 Tax=Sporisorium graminicola TaxID=280036 RepID=A0A4U7KXQ5_9BASI|nr:hypothetical protein EX895_002004 [Sporisorium graminicola]TKY89473.1 hypothetical protein EX895_002004 [Sporisorium graminicola]